VRGLALSPLDVRAGYEVPRDATFTVTPTTAGATSLFDCAAKSASRGKPADPACTTKMQDKLMTAFTKADASGPCSGDPFLVGLLVQFCAFQVPTADSTGRVMGVLCH
jgi:hypothetical protein